MGPVYDRVEQSVGWETRLLETDPLLDRDILAISNRPIVGRPAPDLDCARRLKVSLLHDMTVHIRVDTVEQGPWGPRASMFDTRGRLLNCRSLSRPGRASQRRRSAG